MARDLICTRFSEGNFMMQAYRGKVRLLPLLLGLGLLSLSWAAGPATTRINDVVYRADGTPAAGTLLITWPAFTAADGTPVAAGTKSVTLGAQGALTVDLVPSAGGSPAKTLYRVVYKLDDGTTNTEYWSVGTTSPTTVAAVRTTLGANPSAQIVSRQYVDTVVANKADDTAVVHRSGTEVIEGNKQFSAPPAVPTPLLATDAANKAYVDGAVAAVGAGSFVSKTGDAMSGPLTLPGNPTASNHAANKGYVDTALSAKADLMGGKVPADELGSGGADGSKCLKGDGTWGACGTSSNAISIQGIPVDTAAPTDGQVPTYEAASGMYKPKPGGGGGLTAGMQAIKYATDFAWVSSPSGDLSAPGAKSVTLSSCPAGVKGNEPEYWVYISGTGTPEAVKVTGGTCAGNGSSGTLQFTTANAHPAGYTIKSASGGLQEASIAARFTPSNPTGSSQAGKIIAPPGELDLYARVSFRGSYQTIDMSASIVTCWMDDTCIFVGDPGNSNNNNDITIVNPRGRPAVAGSTKPFLEVNAQKTRLYNVVARTPYSGGTFGSMVQVDDDQSFLLDGIDTVAATTAVRCDTTFCGAWVTAPGPFNTWSAVGWLKNLNLSLQCNANGVDWQSGNTLHIEDSVIQGYSQFGIRSGTARGGYNASTTISNVYMELGSCSNKIAGLGVAGIIQQGAHLQVEGGIGPQGKMPQFANTGTTHYLYYVVARHATYGPSVPLYVGYADTNGAGNITVTTPDIAGATSFDLLRATRTGSFPYTQAPNGTGNWAVAAGVTRASACANGVCTFTDTQAALTSYTVADPPTYLPKLDFWNGDIVLASKADGTNVNLSYTPTATILGNTTQAANVMITERGTLAPSVVMDHCPWKADWEGKWVACMSADSHAFIWGDPNGVSNNIQNMKGRLNFGMPRTVPTHAVTLSDSNFAKTIAHANNRPPNDANDAFIGWDHKATNGDVASVGIAFGAPYSISNYIGNAGDDSNWKERLTATLKTFKVPVDLGSNVLQGSEITTPSNPSSGTQKAYFKAGSGLCSLDSTGTERCTGSGGGSSPLTTKGDLFTFSTTNTRLPAGANGQCLQADSTQPTGLKWGSCGSGGTGESDTYTPSGGTKTISGNFHVTGNAQVDGQLSVAGPWLLVSDVPSSAMSATASKTTMGVDSDGKVKVSENGGAVTELAKKGAIDASDMASANKQGTGTKFGMAAGSFTPGNYRSTDSNGNQIDAGVKAGPYSMWLTVTRAGSPTGAQPASTANKAMLWGVVLPFPLTTTKVTYIVGTADNTANTYDIGIYDSSGNLVVHIGATPGTTFAPTAGARSLNWSASATLQPGKYYLALTSSCTSSCAALNADNGSGFTFQAPTSTGNLSITTGGLLPGSATMPADNWSGAAYIPAWAVWQ
jgi:hypothetical protein